MSLLNYLKAKIRGTMYVPKAIKDGCKIGKNFDAQTGSVIDPGYPWLITIGDNVTLGPGAYILAHDASMHKSLGFSKIGRVIIGGNVFIGARAVVLPNVSIVSNTIIGSGCVVTKDIGPGVWVGNPARKICEYDEWINRHKKKSEICPFLGLIICLTGLQANARTKLIKN